MIQPNSLKYNKNKRGTTLSVRFNYKEEVRIGVDLKENIQARLDLGYEFKEYLEHTEGLKLNSPFYAFDGNGLGREVGFEPSKRRLSLKVCIKSKQQILEENMLDLKAFDLFIARGKLPGK